MLLSILLFVWPISKVIISQRVGNPFSAPKEFSAKACGTSGYRHLLRDGIRIPISRTFIDCITGMQLKSENQYSIVNAFLTATLIYVIASSVCYLPR